MATPPLATRVRTAKPNSTSEKGELDNPETAVIFGGDRILTDMQPGGRLQLGEVESVRHCCH